MSSGRRSASLEVAASATCAVLYAMGSYLTAYISSPWGSGQFRPAVVIPSIFSTLFGPLAGGVGAAVGTLIVDSAKHGQIYIRSLVSSVPGNFVGFYLFGWIIKRKFSWENFIKASQVTLLISNIIVAFLYVYFRAFVDVSYPVAFREAWIYVSLGLVAWWYVTMLPFVLLLGPPLIRSVASAFPGLVSEEIRSSTLKGEVPRRSFSMAMVVPGSLMLLIGVAITLGDPGQIVTLNLAPSPLILAGMQVMFLASGALLLILGLLVQGTGRLIVRAK
mgnify:CR=1 FL=1